MKPEIKLRDVTKGTVKTLDKAANVGDRMKQAYVRTKDKAEHSTSPQEGSANEYAADRITGTAEVVSTEVVHQFDKQGRKAVSETKDNITKAKELLQKRKADLPKRQAQKQARTQAEKAVDTARKATNRGAKTIKTVDRGTKTVKQTAKSTGKATVKGAQKTVKTAEQTGRTAIKTSQAAAKTAQKTAQAAAKASQRAVQAAKAAAKATVAGIKAAVKATIAAVKAIIESARALISLIMAGGWLAVGIIAIICMVALIVCSCFGIFFSTEDTGSVYTLKDVVQEINNDYQAQIDTIKSNITYDVLEITGSTAVWPEVLSVYAVKTTSDPDNPQEVATMDDSKKAILKDIFWQMNAISSRMENREETVITETDDGNGNIVQTETTVTQTVLYITVTHKTADEMADHFGFTEDQQAQLDELLKPENHHMWETVLAGIDD